MYSEVAAGVFKQYYKTFRYLDLYLPKNFEKNGQTLKLMYSEVAAGVFKQYYKTFRYLDLYLPKNFEKNGQTLKLI